MNMYGIMTPQGAIEHVAEPTRRERLVGWIRDHRPFMLVVVAPVLILAAYLYLVMADQYVSESHFVVRSSDENPMEIGGAAAMLGIGTPSATAADASSVADYLSSHDVVAALEKRMDLVAMFRRSEADPFSRMWSAHPTPERLLRNFREHVRIRADQESGITALVVRGFRPADAFQLNHALLDLGEQRVNEMNVRSYEDSVRMARNQLADAEANVRRTQSTITRFRQAQGDINPTGTGEAQIRLVSALQQQLATAKAQLAAMGSLINRSSPQYVALAARVRSLQAEIAAQDSKLAGGRSGSGETIATSLGGFEDLKIRQDFAGKRYEAAAANLEKAREAALRQQLYIVRVVNPNMPVKSLYPRRGQLLLTVTLGLLLAYGIGWLLVAGVREHAA